MMPADSQKRDSTPSRKTFNEELKIHSPLSDNEGACDDILCSLSMLILSGRSLFEQKPQVSKIKEVLYDIIARGYRRLCIDVNGHRLPFTTTTSVSYQDNEMIILNPENCEKREYHSNDMILIEKWTLSLIPYDSSYGTTNVQFLLQAMKSFLYFSQINSWSVSNGGKCPFGLFHRVYTDNITSTTPSSLIDYQSPEYHKFPLVRLDSSSTDCIEVHVTYLPRLDTIPSQLISEEENQLSIDLNNKLSIEVTYNRDTHLATNTSIIELSPTTDNSSTISQLVQTCDDKATNEKNGFDKLHDKSNSNSSSIVSGGVASSQLVYPLTHKLGPNPSPSKICSEENNDETSNGDLVTTEHIKSSRLIISNLHRPSPTNNCTSVVTHPLQIDKNTSKGVQPSGASSPIPLLFCHSPLKNPDPKGKDNRKKLKRRSCGVYSLKNSSCPTPPTRSMSLPAVVPNLCLLGTFEESVLNGRIDPLGYVDGFTAELGASGSFCPPHISLPVSAAFFSLSDDRGSSPYLGHVDLSILRKRGYHIPRKGTVQLTLFNPNKTVIKVFIIVYDHSDMPSSTTTFIRQKTLSRSLHEKDSQTGLTSPCLQYLIHLRFLCSESGHVYLHTDIKMLFARRAPDTDPDVSQVSLFTAHEGPVNPKYGPLSKELS